MRTDPRAACRNEKERFWWAFVHDLVAHPLMALTNWSRPAQQFHNWTSFHAWPRAGARRLQGRITLLVQGRSVVVEEVAPSVWRVYHPTVDHAITLTNTDPTAAATQALSWFHSLSAEFGGRFTLTERAQPCVSTPTTTA